MAPTVNLPSNNPRRRSGPKDSMSKIDPIFAAVTAPGTPFEIGEQEGLRFFVNAPQPTDRKRPPFR
jgi:hypothetical protein